MTPGQDGDRVLADDNSTRSAGLGPRDLIQAARSGQSAMAVGLIINGLAAYIFLAAAGRALGPEDFAPVSVLWAALFLVATGLFQPFEQELGRSVAARRARHVGAGQLVSRSGALAGALYLAVSLVTLAARSGLADLLFRGNTTFVWLLVAGVAGVGMLFFVRGLLAGFGRYYGYAVLFLSDALAKSVPAVLLALIGVAQAEWFASVVVIAGFVGAAVPLSRGWRLGEPGPPPPWRPLSSSLSFLLLTSALSALTLNIGTVAVEVLATDSQAGRAGVFLSGLVISRIPLFLFQAVQAIILPRLSRHAAAGEMTMFRSDLRALGVGMTALTSAAVIGSALLGPMAVRLLFGEEFALLGARDMGLLTLASMLMMCALAINQAQLALQHQRQTGWPWGLASVVFLVVIAFASSDLFLRVELGMVAAGVTVVLTAGTLLGLELRHPDEHRDPIVSL